MNGNWRHFLMAGFFAGLGWAFAHALVYRALQFLSK